MRVPCQVYKVHLLADGVAETTAYSPQPVVTVSIGNVTRPLHDWAGCVFAVTLFGLLSRLQAINPMSFGRTPPTKTTSTTGRLNPKINSWSCLPTPHSIAKIELLINLEVYPIVSITLERRRNPQSTTFGVVPASDTMQRPWVVPLGLVYSGLVKRARDR